MVFDRPATSAGRSTTVVADPEEPKDVFSDVDRTGIGG